MNMVNLPAKLRSLPDIVAEYDAKVAGLPEALRTFETAIGAMNSAGKVTSKSFMLFGDEGEISINFHVQSLDRRNPRKGEALAKWVEAHLAEIIPLALAKKWPDLDAFLTTFPAHDRCPALV